MSDFFGKSVRLSLFGESHSLGIGFVLTNLPPGLPIDRAYIEEALCRRRGPVSVSTPRREKDEYVFLSGIRKDPETGEVRASGTPLAVLIWNKDVDSGPYEEVKDIPRPSHADYTGSIRYRGYHDYRGGGAFSGRLTCPLVFAGSIVRKVLEDKGVIIGSHLAQVGPLKDGRFADGENLEDAVRKVGKSDFPLIREDLRSDFFALLSRAKEDKDSLGGRLETVVVGLKPGYGSLFFDKLDARLAHAVLTIPGIKGISFGSGFQLAAMKGSQANDPMVMTQEGVSFLTNHSGGIQGGISNGMPLVFQTVVKPTPSIGKVQTTVNLKTGEEEKLVIHGRHDPSIVHRAFEVVNAMTALVLFDLILSQEGPDFFLQ
ncbi:chorismate synthase [Kallipyga gabonensis]|uniref:chorismate synthase n=1 Tax=Kallipyga gabonensis TaxID=1686287 RepID=UPI0006B41BF6|nr:chorismate synthase [Kallipyga gabonensis]